MRIAVCDDDEQELAHFSELMTKYQASRGISFNCCYFHTGTDLLWNMKGGEYDLVLLDALMPGVNGIETAKELRELDKNVKIVFVSVSAEFALESYSVGAYYYLLKPVDIDSLFSLLDKAADELAIQKEQGFVLKRRDGIVSIAFARLEYVEVVNKTVSFHLADGVIYEVSAALSDFEGLLLSRPEFMKTHRSYIVNLSYVRSVDARFAVTKNGHNIPVSRMQRSQVQDAYLRFLHQDGFASGHTQFCYGRMLVDLTKRQVSVDGKELSLSPVEFDILWRLSEHPEHIFTPEEIFELVWNGQLWDGGQMVQSHMSKLRRKLEKTCEGHCYIETVWGQGYRFVPDIEKGGMHG